ncbi:MAG: hypothetical protein MJZ74_07600 [Muribaculaceae bacterium]|nr:hypothetical protein [Muribaculaceae bacterium]
MNFKAIALTFVVTLAVGIAVGTSLVSCDRTTRLSADEKTINLEMDGGKGTVGLHTDNKELHFVVDHAPSWVSVSIADSTLTYTAGTNDTQAVREDSVVIKCDNRSVSIKFVQAVRATYLSVEPESVTLPKEGGTSTVSVHSDGCVQVDCPEGITATLSGDVLSIDAPNNNGNAKSYSVNLIADEFTSTVKVTVKGNVCSRCKGKGSITCPECRGQGIICSYTEYNEWTGEYECADYVDCWNCGSGSMFGRVVCPSCHGTGH